MVTCVLKQITVLFIREDINEEIFKYLGFLISTKRI